MSEAKATKRKTYAQGRRDERAAIARAMRPHERIVAEAKFEHLKIDGRNFIGRGKIEIYEEVFRNCGFSSSFELPGLRSWRVKFGPRRLSPEDKEFVFGLWGNTQASLLIFEPDGPNNCHGHAWLMSSSISGRNHWRFMGEGKLAMEAKKDDQ